ncbi:MAG TPA: hypothetical protein VEK11_06010 [Thermoanaerobaculia bacterium]|nr:hypothetical protein [Thermoanaerobaculia bacterium]
MFRSNGRVYALRGQVLTTYATNEVGNLQIEREDFVGSMAARETEGAVVFSNGRLFISSEAGLEIYDLRNVRAGGNAPILVHRAPGFHYRRMAISGNRLAGLFPATDMSCHPDGGSFCTTHIDVVDISTLTNPTILSRIQSYPFINRRAFNDVAFNAGYLIALSEESLIAFDITNPMAPREFADDDDMRGKFLVSDGNSFLGVGDDHAIWIYNTRAGVFPFFNRSRLITIPQYLTIERSNPIRFNRHASWDEAGARLTTLIEEINPMNLRTARTIAFAVYDFTVRQDEGSASRVFENVTLVNDDEVKHNPLAVGNYVYVVGERTGIETWGSCGVAAGKIELDSPTHLTCGGAQIHGWVTGQQKIVNVELFLDNQVLGAATLGPIRTNVSSPTPVSSWRVNVNLDNTPRGEYQLRAIATDALGVRRQFAMRRIFFEGPGRNCSILRRRAVR